MPTKLIRESISMCASSSQVIAISSAGAKPIIEKIVALLHSGKSSDAIQLAIDNPLFADHELFVRDFCRLIESSPIDPETSIDSQTSPVDSEIYSVDTQTSQIAPQALIEFLTNELFAKNKKMIDVAIRIALRSTDSVVIHFKDSQLANLCLFIYKNGNAGQKKQILVNLKLYSLLSKGLLTSYQAADASERETLLPKLIKLAIRHYDSLFLKKLIKAIGTTDSVPQTLAGRFLLSLKNKEDQKEVLELMNQFNYGPGGIKLEGGYFTLAQIRAHHNPNFDPTLIDGNELNEYLIHLKNHPRPTRARFIYADTHWFVGDIKLESNGDVSLVLIDSIGFEDIKLFDAAELIQAFIKVFPNAHVHLSYPKTQAKLGCSLIAIDTALHLYDLEPRGLEEKYHTTGLHGYAAADAKKLEQEGVSPIIVKTEEGSSTVVKPFRPPLSLMTAMQSRKLLEDIDRRDEAERKLPINKRGDLPTRAYIEAKFFKPNSLGVPQNIRLDKVRRNFRAHNLRYLTELNEEKKSDPSSLSDRITEATFPFTVEAFETQTHRKRKRDNQDEIVDTPNTKARTERELPDAASTSILLSPHA